MSMNKPSGFKGSSDTCSILKDFYKTLASSVMSSKIKSEKKFFRWKILGHYIVFILNLTHAIWTTLYGSYVWHVIGLITFESWLQRMAVELFESGKERYIFYEILSNIFQLEMHNV